MLSTLIGVLATAATLVGAGIHLWALVPARAIAGKLRPGPTRTRWRVLRVMIWVFLIGYVVHAGGIWLHPRTLDVLLASAVFLGGACFVRIAVRLSLTTIDDVSRIAELEHENITDPLTGVRNRRFLDRTLRDEFLRARRYGLQLSVMLLDVDLFKRVNDTYGHLTGDRVLVGIAKIVGANVRACDIVARYGGEELCVIAVSTPAHGALVLAERLRGAVAEATLALPKTGQPIRATVSIGVASLSAEHADAEALVKAADTALYAAKRAGRNRVTLATRDVEAPRAATPRLASAPVLAASRS